MSSPTRDRKPAKSILRNAGAPVHHATPPRTKRDLLDQIHQGTIDASGLSSMDAVVDAALRALLTAEPGSHLKAYNALVQVFKYDDRRITSQTLVDKLNQLLSFAKRDLQWSEASKNALDSRVTIAILKVVDFLLLTDETALSCDYETARWFLLRGIETLENKSSSKAAVCAYTHIFYSQRLPRALPNEVASRLLHALSTRTNFQSTNAAAEYLAAYRRLVQTHPTLMIAEASKWMSITLRSLVHASSTVRHQALGVVQECVKRLPANKTIGRCVWTLMNEPEQSDRSLPAHDASQGNLPREDPPVETDQ